MGSVGKTAIRSTRANESIPQPFIERAPSPARIFTGAVLRNLSTALFPNLNPGSLYSTTISEENRLPGTSNWRITGRQEPGQIEGFADSTYASDGTQLPIYVSTLAQSFQIEAYRMGWYQGLLGRLVWRSPSITGTRQPKCLFIRPSNTTECSNWSTSYTMAVTNAFVPGDYLLKLVSSTNQQEYIPLTVVDPSSNAAVAVVNAVTDWQAYNTFGGYSLYQGPYNLNPSRATKVSFDRPYAFSFGFGSGDFLGNELPLISLVEKLGLNVTYVNSTYLQKYPTLVMNHNVMVSLGHDEYYSPTMKGALQDAVNNGRSLMFLGANAIFRRIRFENSPFGQNRIEVNYRNPYQDPLFGIDNADVTANWPSYPAPSDESSLIGLHYQCNPVNAPMIITDPSSWIFAGTNVSFGTKIPHLIGSEFDQFLPYSPHPPNIQLLAHSPLLCRNVPYFSDMSYYSTTSGGGVFATGTNYWVVTLGSGCPPFTGICPDPITDQVTANVLRKFGAGDVGKLHPSVPNSLSVFYRPPFGPMKPAPLPTSTTQSTHGIPLGRANNTTSPTTTQPSSPVIRSDVTQITQTIAPTTTRP